MDIEIPLPRQLIIFDFDGTLADTFNLFRTIFDEVAAIYGFDRFDSDNLATLRNLDARKIMEHHHVTMWKLPMIVRTMRTRMERDIHQVQLFPGISEALTYLHNSGSILALLTSNSRANVLKVLGPENAAHFQHLECGTSIFGKHSKLKKLLKACGTHPSNAIYIGDEIRDYAAATQSSIRFGAVAWGYSNLDALIATGAQETFRDADELTSKLAAFASTEVKT